MGLDTKKTLQLPEKQAPEVLSESVSARSRIFTVQSQALKFSNGTEVVFERLLGSQNGAVLIVPIMQDDTLILIREYGAGVGRYELGFPKGKIDPGEDWQTSAVRESHEEIGYHPENIELLDSVTLAAGYMTHVTHLVLATDLSPKTAEGDEPEPLDIIRWPLSEWQALLHHPEFTEGRAYAALMLALKKRGYI